MNFLIIFRQKFKTLSFQILKKTINDFKSLETFLSKFPCNGIRTKSKKTTDVETSKHANLPKFSIFSPMEVS